MQNLRFLRGVDDEKSILKTRFSSIANKWVHWRLNETQPSTVRFQLPYKTNQMFFVSDIRVYEQI